MATHFSPLPLLPVTQVSGIIRMGTSCTVAFMEPGLQPLECTRDRSHIVAPLSPLSPTLLETMPSSCPAGSDTPVESDMQPDPDVNHRRFTRPSPNLSGHHPQCSNPDPHTTCYIQEEYELRKQRYLESHDVGYCSQVGHGWNAVDKWERGGKKEKSEPPGSDDGHGEVKKGKVVNDKLPELK